MVEDAKLDGEVKPVARAMAGSDDGRVGSVEHVVPGHGGQSAGIENNRVHCSEGSRVRERMVGLRLAPGARS